MQDVSLKQLLEAGCHFGHKAERWHPKANQFIYQKREGIHIIDLAKTKTGLIKAAEFIKDLAKQGKTVLFIGTKKQAANIVKEESTRGGTAFITKRWIGGFMTNWEQVHKNLEKIRNLKNEQEKDLWKKYPKHERVKLGRYLTRLEMFYGGVLQLTSLPDAVFVIDIKREDIAVKEARRQNIPIIAMVDTNSDPSNIDYVIPANDDAVGSIKFIVNYLASAYLEGKLEFEKENKKVEIKAMQPVKPVQVVQPVKPVITKPVETKKVESVTVKPVEKAKPVEMKKVAVKVVETKKVEKKTEVKKVEVKKVQPKADRPLDEKKAKKSLNK